MKQKALFLLFALMIPWGAWAQTFTATTGEGVEMKFSVTNSTMKECKVHGDWCCAISESYSGAVTIPKEANGYKITSIGEEAFANCSLTSISIPESVIYIEWGAFAGCSGLTSIIIPESVISIGTAAFQGCNGLTSIIIPQRVKSIGNAAFEYCRGLTSVSIPESVTMFGNGAFDDCVGLKKVIAANIQSWVSIDFGSESANPLYYAGHLYINNQEVFTVNVPSGVTEIKPYVFCNCKDLVSVKIPRGVTSIGNSSFSDCTGLVSVTIPEGVTSIGNSSFSDCTGLVSVTIPEGVTSIGSSAFSGCI